VGDMAEEYGRGDYVKDSNVNGSANYQLVAISSNLEHLRVEPWPCLLKSVLVNTCIHVYSAHCHTPSQALVTQLKQQKLKNNERQTRLIGDSGRYL
jgi:hypothetical protein